MSKFTWAYFEFLNMMHMMLKIINCKKSFDNKLTTVLCKVERVKVVFN